MADRGGEAEAGSGSQPILQPGRNCWRAETAGRAAVLIDGDEYFRRVKNALEQATRTITIVGWDFDADVRLERGEPESLGVLLRRLVEERDELEVRVLVWNLALVDAPSKPMPLLLGAEWQDHPRIQVKLDHRHPIYGAQHQKIVAIDARIAFVGGIDLTIERWDASEHLPSDPRRKEPDGEVYPPVHDMQMVVDGEAAAAVAEVAHSRWRIATGETVTGSAAATPIWPAGLQPDFVDVPVAISRTISGARGERRICEVAALTLDALSAARDTVYIEAQYFADDRVGALLDERLRSVRGPEVVVITTQATHGAIEGWIMGGNRGRIIRRLRRADRYDRFRIYHPVVEGPEGGSDVLVHAKLLIVDDVFIRIGSANLNRRSTGLDTECDLAIESADPRHRATIRSVRDRLLGEHLGRSRAEIAAAIDASRSLVRTIEEFNGGPRRLESFAELSSKGSVRLMPGTRLFDPRGPLSARAILRNFLPGSG